MSSWGLLRWVLAVSRSQAQQLPQALPVLQQVHPNCWTVLLRELRPMHSIQSLGQSCWLWLRVYRSSRYVLILVHGHLHVHGLHELLERHHERCRSRRGL
jgi:hypothetical protein